MSLHGSKEPSLSSAKNADDLKEGLRMRLPNAAKVADVKLLSEKEHMECSELIDGVIRCSLPAPTRLFLIKAKWLMEFHFDGEVLKDIKVQKGLIGP
jgi:hypothetical protein